MRGLIITLAGFGVMSTSAAAENFVGCTPAQVEIVEQALGTAKDLTLKAAVNIADTSDYQRWFGDYSEANAEKVRANLKAIVTAIRNGGVTAQCDQVTDAGCRAGEYAWVFPDQPYRMYLCPSFFTLPPLEALQPGARRSENGTREGTLVHEISHFVHVADTEDHCYARRECAGMARSDALRAIENADSYQYFTEDVTYFARRPVANKPPPASRSSDR